MNVEGHREALEQQLRNRVEDMEGADQSGPSQWLDFSQSTGLSTINSDATARVAYSHLERALQNNVLVNQNSDLKSHLADEQSKLAACLAQVQLLQEQLTASQQQSGTPAPVDPNDMALDIRGGGGNSEEYKSGGNSEESESGGAQCPMEVGAKDSREHLRGYGLGQGLGSSPAMWLRLVGGVNLEESASRGTQWPQEDWDWYRGCSPGWGRGEGRGHGEGQVAGATQEVIPIVPASRIGSPSVPALVQHFKHYVHPPASFILQGRAKYSPAGTSQQGTANQPIALSEPVRCAARGFSSTYSPNRVSSPQETDGNSTGEGEAVQ